MSLVDDLQAMYVDAVVRYDLVYDWWGTANTRAAGDDYDGAVDALIQGLYQVYTVFTRLLSNPNTGSFLIVNAIAAATTVYELTPQKIIDAWHEATHDELCDTVSGIDFMRKEIWNEPNIKYTWAT